jgi:hypothetical protein
MKKIQAIMILVFLFTGFIRVMAQTATEIDNATKLGKTVFLVAYNTSGVDLDKALTVANEAKKSVKSSPMVVKMNTADVANSTLVTKYRLAGAPLPLILVLDKNGTTAGGLLLKDATAAKLVDLIPSPKTSELLKALANGKSAYIVVYKESMTSKKSIMDNCAVACSKMNNTSVTVMVSADDKGEIKLLQTLKYDVNSKEPVTYVINKSGQVAGTYSGMTDVNTLVATAKKAPAGGCCPGGASSAGCAPKK